ncbi:hypothetical protein HanIR_Chr10g0455231 [Helianthus annuus]|nr:hypothetical protein HanIR_Chr10g0455231 [Helianthus annuus]
MSSSRQYSHSPRKSKFLFIRCTLYYLRSFMMKLFLVNFEPFLGFHFCAYIIRLYIISMHNFT